MEVVERGWAINKERLNRSIIDRCMTFEAENVASVQTLSRRHQHALEIGTTGILSTCAVCLPRYAETRSSNRILAYIRVTPRTLQLDQLILHVM